MITTFTPSPKRAGWSRFRGVLLATFTLALGVFASGCADDEPAAPVVESNTIVDIAVSDAQFSTLVTALTAADLVDTLAGDGPFTVFAPTDDAFAALPEGTLDALLADKEALTNVLTFHVAAGSNDAAVVVGLTSLEMLNGDSADVVVDGDTVTIAGATITVTDIQADNGIIHVLSAVMLPPADEPQSNTIVDIAVGDEQFSTLVTALTEADLVDTLAGDGPFTVFAPTNDAFAALPEGALDALLADKEALTNVLTYHVAAGSNDAAAVVALTSLEMLNGDTADVVVDGDTVTIAGATIIVTDIQADNGIIHVLSAVMLPPEEAPQSNTIVDIAVGDEQFSTLVTALTEADLVDTLAGDGPFTVFAPTNDAFAALPEGALDDLLADKEALTNVLTYHVAAGTNDAAAVVGLTSLEMLNGDSADVVVDGDTVTIAGATIVVTDIQADNGIIHVIDAVMLP
jgi:transforming growth factor-beta-induced protein